VLADALRWRAGADDRHGGVREPTSIRQSKTAPARQAGAVMKKQIADELTELMWGRDRRHRTAGRISEAQVAGKTGTAELDRKPGQENEENPVQIKDAGSRLRAGRKRKLAIGVLL